MNVFVTGATGVIGRRVVPLLVAAGHRVEALARTRAKGVALAAMGATPIVADLFDRDAMRAAAQGQDAIANLATHIPASSLRMMLPGAWRENDRIRQVASNDLVDAALSAGVGRFVQESFGLAYRDAGVGWIDEDEPLAPVRYNRSIVDAEDAAARFAESGGAAVVLRFAGFYGPDAFQSRDMIALVQKGWAPLPGAADAFIASVTHDDAATAVVAALDLPPGVYNVADDEPLTRRAYADTLADALGVPSPRRLPAWVSKISGSMGELLARSQRISNGKLVRASAWRPRYPSAREGWRAVVDELGTLRAGPDARAA